MAKSGGGSLLGKKVTILRSCKAGRIRRVHGASRYHLRDRVEEDANDDLKRTRRKLVQRYKINAANKQNELENAR